MMLTILHVIVIALIVLVVIRYNFILPRKNLDKLPALDAALMAIAVVAAIALFAYDKVVIG